MRQDFTKLLKVQHKLVGFLNTSIKFAKLYISILQKLNSF